MYLCEKWYEYKEVDPDITIIEVHYLLTGKSLC